MSLPTQRCNRCTNCLKVNRVKPSIIKVANGYTSHADDATIALWNGVLKDFPCQLEEDKIKFAYESDGHDGAPTFYIMAMHRRWPDDARMDFSKRSEALAILDQLRSGTMTMEQAATNGRKWL
jgi:hypothetical protein